MRPRQLFQRLLTATRHRVAPARWLTLLAVPLLAVPLLAVTPAHADSPATSTSAAAPQVPAAQTVTTLTGTQIQVNPDGTNVIGRGGPALSYVAPNGDHYVVPALAAPYAGRQLNWSLFDVSAQVRDHITGAAEIPVALSFTSPDASPPPGITITSSRGISALGYMTPSSAPDLAAYLRSQIAADVAAGRPAGTTPLPGLAMITLAAAVPSAGLSPLFAFNDVQLNTPGLTGGANALIELWNMDSFQRLSQTFNSVDGLSRVALPAGNYFTLVQYADFDAQGNLTGVRYVTADFTVPATGGATTFVNLPEATASSLSTAITPQPSQQLNQVITWGLQDATGAWSISSALFDGAAGTSDGADVYVAPQASGPSAGRLRYIVQWDGAAPSPGGSYPYADESSYPYRYDVSFGWDNEIPAGPYQVDASQLATVRDHIYASADDSPADVQFSKAPIDPVLPAAAWIQLGDPTLHVAPGDFTDYVGTANGGDWMFNAGIGPDYAVYADASDPQTFAAGHVYSLDWGRGPLAPEFGEHAARPQALYQNCEACAFESPSGDYLVALYPTDSQDSQQTTYGVRIQNQSGACYINGTQIMSWAGCIDNPAFTPGTAPPSGVNTYRLVLDTSPRPFGPFYTQSTPTHTDLTFRFQYKTQPPPDMTLPSGYECEQQTGPGTCEVLPVLTLSYQLAEDETDTSDAPVQHMKLNVGHESFDGIGSQAPITSASVQVSFDGGTTWQPAVLGGTHGNYTASWHNPASAQGTSPALKVTATDSIGGSITQVIDNAYNIG